VSLLFVPILAGITLGGDGRRRIQHIASDLGHRSALYEFESFACDDG
jgi:hypothetical protein